MLVKKSAARGPLLVKINSACDVENLSHAKKLAKQSPGHRMASS